jgi:GTP diphosphokinase / guanosine-3',5'-bis(diphosphate) 3'-diphosphatase
VQIVYKFLLFPKHMSLNHLEKFSAQEQELIAKALEFATRHHSSQKRVSGKPYIVHPIAVAQSLIDDFHADAETIAAGLLHDTVEDTAATLPDIEQEFGHRVKFLVDGTTDVGVGDGHEPIADWEVRWNATMEKAHAYAAKDKGVYIIKIADRWHNLTTCSVLRSKNQVRLVRTTKEFHLPACRELGFASQAREIEKVCEEIIKRNELYNQKSANQRYYLR